MRDDSAAAIVVGEDDLRTLSNLLDRYSRVGGLSNDLTDPVIIAIARAGGSAPLEEIFQDVAAGRQDPNQITARQYRPWFWMLRVAQAAVHRDETLLALRIALFIGMWADNMAPLLTQADLVELGIAWVPQAVNAQAAVLGMQCAMALPGHFIAGADTTGSLTAGQSALIMACRIVKLGEKGVAFDPDVLEFARRTCGALGDGR